MTHTLVSSQAPAEALQRLEHYAEVVPFHSDSTNFPPLASHPDLFVFQCGTQWAVAPNLSQPYCNLFPTARVGATPVGDTINSVSAYNVAAVEGLAVGNPKTIDPQAAELLNLLNTPLIPVRQGLARCAALLLSPTAAITSDPGIHKALLANGVETLLVSAEPILLPGYKSGCFGGCCGILGEKVFLLGSLDYHPQGTEIRQYLERNGKEPVELYAGPLFDGGSIFFV